MESKWPVQSYHFNWVSENQYAPCSEKPARLAGPWCLLLRVLHKTNTIHFIMSPLFTWGDNTAVRLEPHTHQTYLCASHTDTSSVWQAPLWTRAGLPCTEKKPSKAEWAKNLIVVWVLSLVVTTNKILPTWPFPDLSPCDQMPFYRTYFSFRNLCPTNTAKAATTTASSDFFMAAMFTGQR